MVQLDGTLEMYTADLVSRLSLMCIEPTVEPKIKQPYSDPSHLSSKCRQAVHRIVNKSHLLPSKKDKTGSGVTINKMEILGDSRESGKQNYQGNHESQFVNQDDVQEMQEKYALRKSKTLEGSDTLYKHPSKSKLRLSYPITHSLETQLPHSYNLGRGSKSRPLTPILKTHCTRLPTKPVATKPIQIDFLTQLPVDITLLMLKYYISPSDLLNLRLVNRYYHMLCQLKQVKCRWKEFISKKSLDAKQRGQENPIPRTSWVNMSPMSQSLGVLSPIQNAASLSKRWHVYSSPQSTLVSSPGEPKRRQRHLTTVSTAARGVSPHTPSRVTRRSVCVQNSPHTPASVGHKTAPVHHPSKRAPSHRDIKYDSRATPDKNRVTGSTSGKRRDQGFLTPSKRYADGINKISRTPLKTLNFGTPSSTCSSRTSVSSTTSLVTPDIQSSQFHTPTSVECGFKVPPLPSRSRQRLKRL